MTRALRFGRSGGCFGILVSVLCSFCSATPVAAQTAAPPPVVSGAKSTPRLASGHPCTLWDRQDVAAYKASFSTNAPLKAAFEELRAWGDKRVMEPLNVPAHKLEADGNWSFPAFKRGYQDGSGKWNWEWKFNGTLQERAEDASNLGMLYALTDDEKYGTFAEEVLLALADAYGYGKGSTIPEPHGYDHFEAYGFDGGDIGMFLAKVCHGYDLIHNLPSCSGRWPSTSRSSHSCTPTMGVGVWSASMASSSQGLPSTSRRC
jgi:hypothetical protein